MRVGFSRVLTPTAWAFYIVIVFEILFMISPFALHFYSTFGPALNFLHHWPATTWLTKFYLPHFTETASPLLNAAPDVGQLLIVAGLGTFLTAAIPVYWAKLRGGGPVTGGLYAAIRHPQYLALAVTGVGTALVWPRFLVLITFVTMIFLYTLLADWEEQQCAARFGESYRRYQERTGRFLPKLVGHRVGRILPAAGAARVTALVALYVVAVAIVIGLAFAVRDRSIAHLATLYEEDSAVISTAYLGGDEVESTYRIAVRDERVGRALEEARGARFLVYVVPSDWSLPDLPLDVANRSAGHHVPSDFDRRRYTVLFARARFHGSPPSGAEIVRAAYGLEPVIVAHVDAHAQKVTDVAAPPPHVRWGDIPTPTF